VLLSLCLGGGVLGLGGLVGLGGGGLGLCLGLGVVGGLGLGFGWLGVAWFALLNEALGRCHRFLFGTLLSLSFVFCLWLLFGLLVVFLL